MLKGSTKFNFSCFQAILDQSLINSVSDYTPSIIPNFPWSGRLFLPKFEESHHFEELSELSEDLRFDIFLFYIPWIPPKSAY